MVERLIQTIKRRLAVLDIDPNWSNTTLANQLANIIENIRLTPNTTTKISPFEAHFGRKPNTEISNITTKTSHNNLTYKNLTKYCLDKKLLTQNALTMEEIWKRWRVRRRSRHQVQERKQRRRTLTVYTK